MALNQKSFGDIITFTRASAATRINSLGVMESVAANVPRIDYDPVTLAVRGLLVEEQRTNLLLYSADPSNAAWIKNSASIGAGTTGPAGLAAQKLVEASGASLSPSLAQSATVADAATVTGWRFVKSGERSFARMQISSSGGTAYAACRFSLTDGTKVAGDTDVALNSATNVKSGAINWGNGWWMLWLSCTLPAGATTASIQTRIVPDAGTFAYTGDGSSGIYVGPGQLEVGGFPTSYIATTGSQVSRGADIAQINTLSPWYNAIASTLYVEFTPMAESALYQRILDLNDGTANNSVRSFRGGGGITQMSSTAAGVSDVSLLGSGNAATGVVARKAMALERNNMSISLNGAAPSVDNSCEMPSVTNLRLGHTAGTPGAFLNGYFRKVRYYPKRLSNAELQALTA